LLTVDLPFAFGEAELERCAGEFGAIVVPLAFFCLGPATPNTIRLAFSTETPERLQEAVRRLARFLDAMDPDAAPKGSN
jgi:(S)-3,5-dihydroxyphenylglycine transaminase